MSPRKTLWVSLAIIVGLATLKGVSAGWSWLQRKRLARQVKQSFFSTELEQALLSIKEVIGSFEKDVRDNVKWNWTRDRLPSVLVDLLILNTVHERATMLRLSPPSRQGEKLSSVEEAVGKEAARYVRFASAAYGMVMLKATLPGKRSQELLDSLSKFPGWNVMSWDVGWPPMHKLSYQELNAWCITRHCGIEDEDLLQVNLAEHRKLHLPGYIIAVDHSTSSVVLSVRGTFSVQDAITDLVCDCADFMGGACHRGLRQGAELLLEDAREELVRALNRHKGYRLVLCGHSLGAGVSILLTMLVLQRRKELGLGGKKVVCYAFAPPPVFGPLDKLSGEARDAIHAFAFGNDMVTRLSMANAYELFRDLKEIGGMGVNFAVRCRYLARERMPHVRATDDGLGAVGMEVVYRYPTILQRTGSLRSSMSAGQCGEKHPVEEFVQRKLSQDFTENGRPRHGAQSREGSMVWPTFCRHHPTCKYEKLMIPGKIFHMRKLAAEGRAAPPLGGTTPKGDAEKAYWIERASPEEFERLLIVDTAIMDHLPKVYEEALHTLFGDGLELRPK